MIENLEEIVIKKEEKSVYDFVKKFRSDNLMSMEFKDESIYDFIKKYKSVERILTCDNLKADKISQQLNDILLQNHDFQKNIFQESIKKNRNALLIELQNSKDENIKMLLENFKDNIFNIGQSNLNEYEKKNLSTVCLLKSTLDNHTINEKIGEIEKNVNSMNNNFTKSSSKKGEMTENALFNSLIKTLPCSELINTSQISQNADILIRKDNKPDILIDSKNFKNNVPKIDIDKFYNDCNLRNSSGILCNAFSGISNRKNFQIDIINTNILIFISNHEFKMENFKLAVDIIYNMYNVVKARKSNDITINNILFERLKNEFNHNVQDSQSYIDDMKRNLNGLEKVHFKLLNSFFNNYGIEVKPFTCNICGGGYTTDKILKAHVKKVHG